MKNLLTNSLKKNRLNFFFSTLFTLLISFCGDCQETWHQLDFTPPGESAFGALCSIDENVLYVMLDEGRFYKSMDGGTSWTENETGISENFFDLVFFDANLGFAVGTNGTILKTSDAGTTWNIIPTETTENLFSMTMISLNDIWVVGHHGTVLHSIDGGNTWVLDNSLSTEKLNSVQFNGNLGYIAGNNGTLLQTFDYGATWNTISLNTDEDFFSLNITQNNTQFLSGNVEEEYYFNSGERIFKTTDDENWTSYTVFDDGMIKSNLYFANDNLGFLFSSAQAMCDCSDMAIYRTIDAGTTWEVSFCGYSSGGGMVPGYSDFDSFGNEMFYALNKDHIFKTTNAGAEWNEEECNWVFSVENFNSDSFSIYPNPSHGNKLNIEFLNNSMDAYSVEIIDLNGKHIFSVEKIGNEPINISNLKNGLYFVTILNGEKIIGSEKFIKSN